MFGRQRQQHQTVDKCLIWLFIVCQQSTVLMYMLSRMHVLTNDTICKIIQYIWRYFRRHYNLRWDVCKSIKLESLMKTWWTYRCWFVKQVQTFAVVIFMEYCEFSSISQNPAPLKKTNRIKSPAALTNHLFHLSIDAFSKNSDWVCMWLSKGHITKGSPSMTQIQTNKIAHAEPQNTQKICKLAHSMMLSPENWCLANYCAQILYLWRILQTKSSPKWPISNTWCLAQRPTEYWSEIVGFSVC